MTQRYLGRLIPVMVFLVPVNPAGSTLEHPRFAKLGAEKGESAEVPVISLSSALKDGKTGIEFEYSKKELRGLEKQVATFVAYRSGELGIVDRASFIVGCLTRSQSNPFCEFLKDEETGQKNDAQAGKPITLSAKESKKRILAGEPSGVKDLSTRSLGRGLRRVSKYSQMELMVNRVLEESSCFEASLYTQLGLKIEEFFPDEKYRRVAAKLYSKGDHCGSKNNHYANLARFRLSLIHIWDDNCQEALPLLGRLLMDREKTHETRAIFWQAQCARQGGDKLKFAVKKNRLIKTNPLGYHALFLNDGRPLEVVNLMYSDKTPEVMMRSEKRPEVNPLVRAIEILQRFEEFRMARSFFRVLRSQLEDTEPEFQLYAAVLANRSGEVIRRFRILSNAFRNHTQLISRQTMELFYPLKNFKTIWRHRGKVDPYLLAALIRQESGFLPGARSPAGALGLMQLMPRTARRMERVSKWQLLKPRVNVRLGVRYFHRMLSRFGGDAELALAAYNAGPHRVDSWLKRYPTDNKMLFLDLMPFSETRNYVSLIGRNYFWYLSLYAPEALAIESRSNSTTRVPASIRRARQKARFSAFSSF